MTAVLLVTVGLFALMVAINPCREGGFSMGSLDGKVLENLKRDRNEAIGAVLLLLLLSGCSALDNSERYYKNRPYQPINYRTYQTD
jgi:hypothetical protein